MTFSEAKDKDLLPPVTGFNLMILEMLLIATVVKVERRPIILMPSDRRLAPSSSDVVDVSPDFFDKLQATIIRSSNLSKAGLTILRI